MSKKKFVINIRGGDDLNIRGQCWRIGEAGGWTVEEQTSFDESESKMLTRQLCSQEFDDPAAGERAANELETAINKISNIAVILTPDPVSP